MGFFRSLFLGSSNDNKSSLKKGSGAYESTVALEPPVKGSYPVAGNGNVEETLQRAKVRKEAKQSNGQRTASFAGSLKPPTILSQVQSQRPRTAPHNGEPGGGQRAGELGHERTRSGFSMKAPPHIFSTRRDSLKPLRSPPPVEAPSKLQSSQTRQVQTYQPRTAASTQPPTPPTLYSESEPVFTPPYAENHHQRSFSHASQGSHVDILDAYSSIRGKEASKHRVKAAGVRSYGEDVADRNIADFGDKDLSNLDLNSQEFGYMKTIYTGKKRHEGDDIAQRSAPMSPINGDDTMHTTQPPTSRFSNASRPGVNSPPRNNYHTENGSSQSQRGGEVFTSKQEYAPVRESRQPRSDINLSSGSQYRTTGQYSHVDPPPRVNSLVQPRTTSAQETPRTFQNAPRINSPAHSRKSSSNKPSTHHGHSASKNSVSYSAFPQVSPREHSSQGHTSPNTSRPLTSPNKRSYLVEEAMEAPKLESNVNQKKSVNTEVITKNLPAVTHEYVQPFIHEHRQEKITREIHTHDVFHRIQPIIETEILPTKHYVHAPDGKSLIEIPENQIPGRTHAGAANKNWKIIETPLGQGDYNQPSRQSRANLSFVPPQTVADNPGFDDAAEPPVIALARGDGFPGTRSRTTSLTSRTKSIFEPILASKRESRTFEGVPKTEYLWRHPPTFDNYSRPSSSRSGQKPVYIGAGIGDISDVGVAAVSKRDGRGSHSSSEYESGYVLDSTQSRSKEGEELLFRDSGYGSGGGLPGISPGSRQNAHGLVDDFEKMKIASSRRPRRSGARGLEDKVVREDNGENEIPDVRGRGSSKGVRTKKSSVDLRGAAGEQAGSKS